MNPFFFGRSERPLFGLFTRGRSADGAAGAPMDGGAGAAVATRERGVLLCYPVGSEYQRAHRAFRQLNTMLNRAGFHVLRFDYSCTGDSAGAGVEASLEEWIDDVDWAVDELLDTAGIDTLGVVGLRWGATLAALAARERDEIRHLVLWDPVVAGTDYLDEVMPDAPADETVGVKGYPFTPQLREALGAVDLRRDLEGSDPPAHTSLVVSEPGPRYDELAAALEARGDRMRFDVVPSPGNWSEVDPFGDALIPQDIIRAIIDRLEEEG